MTTITTTHGDIEGADRGGHHAFLGVPFAAPPTGTRRFRAPEPPEPWPGVWDATKTRASSAQYENPMQGFAAEGPKDEDCLYLNVFTPAPDASRRPVMFWIHGGGFTHGSGSRPLFDGGRLAERNDVVVVTVHYRLGVLGFTSFEGILEGATANAGLLDLIAALEWVRDNIEGLGGDPDNVTIFGESAGASLIMNLLAMPAARGLFHRAISQSGSGRSASREDARTKAEMTLEALGLDLPRAEELRSVSVEQILEAQQRVEEIIGNDQPRRIGPVRDDVTLPVTPFEAVEAGLVAHVPLLIGTNRDEMKLWSGMQRKREPITDADLPQMVLRAIPAATPDAAPAMIEATRESRRTAGLPHENTDILDALLAAARFAAPSIRLALAQSQHQPHTYRYLFTWESPARRGALGACHALEMAFVFGTLDAPTQDKFAGTGPEAEQLSAHMMDAWTAFARTGNPSHDGIGDWPAFEPTRRTTMLLGRECTAEDNPFGTEIDAVMPFV